MTVAEVPEIRINTIQAHEVNKDGDYVLYWMTAFRRTHWNFALQRAAYWAEHLKKPLLIFEPLRVQYRWASERFHQFVIDGMIDNAAACENHPVTYFPYLEREPSGGKGLMEALCQKAAIVIGDDYPCYFLRAFPRWIARRCPVAIEMVDSNGMIPMRLPERQFTVAHSYRRYMQKTLPAIMSEHPMPEPLKKLSTPKLEKIPAAILRKWPSANLEAFRSGKENLDAFPIDHCVKATSMRGGEVAARKRLSNFLATKSQQYDEDRNHPDRNGSSGLSPYLHFGHISAHQVFHETLKNEGFATKQLGKVNGKVNGFWNVSTSCEAFLDQLLTWREIGFNQCHLDPTYDRYDSLPDWVQATLGKHATDQRPQLYSLSQFESAQTHDPLWNAAQRQLVAEGRMHNYLRMLWGKKILHWSASPQEALAIMIELNNKYALDGRDPNSYSGIFWVLGRYDRPWGPEREVFGNIRYMTSDSTLKKVKCQAYLARHQST